MEKCLKRYNEILFGLDKAKSNLHQMLMNTCEFLKAEQNAEPNDFLFSTWRAIPLSGHGTTFADVFGDNGPPILCFLPLNILPVFLPPVEADD